MYCKYCGRLLIKKECFCNKGKTIKFSFTYIIILFSAIYLIPLYISMSLYINYGKTLFNNNLMTISSIVLIWIILSCIIIDTILPYKFSTLAMLFNCHQKKSRSIKIFNKYMPICARCFGMTLGILFSSLLPTKFTIIYIVLGLPLIIDGLNQQFTSYKSNNIQRVITGILFGPLIVLIFGKILYLFLLPTSYIK